MWNRARETKWTGPLFVSESSLKVLDVRYVEPARRCAHGTNPVSLNRDLNRFYRLSKSNKNRRRASLINKKTKHGKFIKFARSWKRSKLLGVVAQRRFDRSSETAAIPPEFQSLNFSPGNSENPLNVLKMLWQTLRFKVWDSEVWEVSGAINTQKVWQDEWPSFECISQFRERVFSENFSRKKGAASSAVG